jgi:hypothetical protein
MDQSKNMMDMLMFFIPAALVLGGMFLMVKKFLDNSYRLKLLETKRLMQKETLPMRIQACERFCLFIERVSPQNLVVRIYKTGMSARDLQTELITNIRAEYEHNVVQQLYISGPCWDAIKNTKEDLIKIVHIAAAQLSENSTGAQLSKAIFDVINKTEKSPTKRAMDMLKAEMHQLLG